MSLTAPVPGQRALTANGPPPALTRSPPPIDPAKSLNGAVPAATPPIAAHGVLAEASPEPTCRASSRSSGGRQPADHAAASCAIVVAVRVAGASARADNATPVTPAAHGPFGDRLGASHRAESWPGRSFGGLASGQQQCAAMWRRSQRATVQAFAAFDPGGGDRSQARWWTVCRSRARWPGTGCVKDIIDPRSIATCYGSPSTAAPAVPWTRLRALLRRAGAVVLGKTVTAELATFAPGPTRNPHAPGHTPGGSSSGSAAAGGGGMAPLALGTQTAAR